MGVMDQAQFTRFKLHELSSALLILAVLVSAVGAKSKDDEGPRAELASLQNETGLALAYFGWYIGTLDFAHRNKLLSAEHLPQPAGSSQNGDLSPHGDMIAFAWSYGTPGSSSLPTNVAPSSSRLGIVWRDGREVREFPAVAQPEGFCWSPDESRIVIHTRAGPSSPGKLYLVNLLSSVVEQIGSGPVLLSTQCWSPDSRHIVYEIPSVEAAHNSGGTVAVYDFATKRAKMLGGGSYPTWSRNPSSIAFLDGDDYYTIQPSGEQRRLLFHAPKASTGVLWSPDSRFVAYGLCCKYASATTLIRFYVRRVRDNAEDWVADVGDVPHARDVHWVAPKTEKAGNRGAAYH
jgi:hypothetical protein